jgi:formate dehydrogenase
MSEWKQSACILCECNCGIEIRLGENGRSFERIRGDKAHPGSLGYTCEKALRLDHYQNGRGERLLYPQRRRADGTYEQIDWDTAIREVADLFLKVQAEHGGESIMYYGGGGQGNHLCGAYSSAFRAAIGSKHRSSALAQEKTGEFWVNGKMMGTGVRGDMANTEVAFFIGKNPWQTHGFPHARTTLKEIAKDPNRSMVVVDVRRTETADLADFFLQVKPGSDAFLLSAMVAILVQDDLYKKDWVAKNTEGFDEIAKVFRGIDVAKYCELCGVDEQLVRAATARIARAQSVAVAEDLGIQMNRHSTLNSYLEKLIWLLTGNFGNIGGQYASSSLVAIGSSGHSKKRTEPKLSPVTKARIITGLIPCNAIPDEILTDHPDRFRGMLVEASNPVHSLADSHRMREALSSLDALVVIDVFMTETARMADYVLPASTQYEKFEATFFNFEFPHNVFHLRRPVVDAPEGPLPEAEIHARLCEATGMLNDEIYAPLRAAAQTSREDFATAFFAFMAERPELGRLAPVILYRTLGESLPHGAAAAAVLWPAAHSCARNFPAGVERAGYGVGLEAGEKLFNAILESPSGVVITDDEYDESWKRLKTAEGKITLDIPELLEFVEALSPADIPGGDPEWPFIFSAGERRSFTANTIIRDPQWRKKDEKGALRLSEGDAARVGVATGDKVRLVTKRGSAVFDVEVNDRMRDGHISVPNGMGLDHVEDGERVITGVSPNELTSTADQDPIAGTPWHKSVLARLEKV